MATCMSVRVGICLCMRVYVYMWVHVCVCKCLSKGVRMVYADMYISTRKYVCVCVDPDCILYVCTAGRMYVYVLANVITLMYVCACIHGNLLCMYGGIYIRTPMYV